jgi:hypothetical protein
MNSSSPTNEQAAGLAASHHHARYCVTRIGSVSVSARRSALVQSALGVVVLVLGIVVLGNAAWDIAAARFAG